jgi:hypothetical protein
LQVGKSSANRASKAANKKAATAAAEEGSAALIAVFSKGAKALEDLRKVGDFLWVFNALALGFTTGFCRVSRVHVGRQPWKPWEG